MKKNEPMVEAWKATWRSEFDQAANIGKAVSEIQNVILSSDLAYGEVKEVLKIVKQNLNYLKIGTEFKKYDDFL